MHYCPGCGHSIIHKLLAQVMDELEIREKTVVVTPVGCSVLMYNYLDCDGSESAHGRAQAVATGLKRALPDRVVIAYQGDGDLAAIGTAETVHSANRGEKFSVIFVNNAIYGMTGGQMAPTTLAGQKTKTSPFGRDTAEAGNPIRVCELLSTLEAPDYIERVSVHDVKNVLKTKKAIKKALQYQLEGRRYSFVEVLSMCPTNWGVGTREAAQWVAESMVEYYPLGLFRDRPTDEENGAGGAAREISGEQQPHGAGPQRETGAARGPGSGERHPVGRAERRA
jgi:2-oxoglutarate ferredoxin oxidoreductase subunit beta